eukprot:6662725-Pyramimonas_sp.AAC.1
MPEFVTLPVGTRCRADSQAPARLIHRRQTGLPRNPMLPVLICNPPSSREAIRELRARRKALPGQVATSSKLLQGCFSWGRGEEAGYTCAAGF